MGPRQCRVCKEAQSKYKCPSCLAPYFFFLIFLVSVVLWSVSRSTKKSHVLSRYLLKALDPESHVERPLNVEEPDDVLQKLQLEAIASSGEIRDALKDENLQKIIRNIDCSPDAENELEKAMGVEAFCMFTDKEVKDSSTKPAVC
ncbi:uncharacterized protein LOC122303732 isoform X4 [Carya illinoinensis]|uniref:uncharacterized protein LOC122303732 isoform X4 n=1 Tax=Carya illinoinensis TaxID=32201 RepID=UPI001C7200DC|nr:uncharacterized protein LOC122303732 isoform X4 [Carya illinoinensis]